MGGGLDIKGVVGAGYQEGGGWILRGLGLDVNGVREGLTSRGWGMDKSSTPC